MPAMTQEQFLKRCTAIHLDKFDYSQVIYRGMLYKIKVICPVHGLYKVKAGNHALGRDCKKCARPRQEIQFRLERQL